MKRVPIGLGLAIAGVLLLAAVHPAAAAPPAFVFEDRNNNGVFDGSDVDITDRLLEETWFETSESVVVTGGPFRARDPHWAQTRDSGGIYIRAGRKITVMSSLLAPYHTSSVALWADTITIGSKVTLDADDYVIVEATNGIVIGDKVKIQSKAGSDNMTLISVVSEEGDIHIGSGFVMTTRFANRIVATNGEVELGPGSQITSTKDSITLIAGTDLTLDAAKVRAAIGADFVAGTGSLSMRSGSVSVKGGAVYIHAYVGSADLRGTKFNPTPDITALSVIW